MSDDKDKKEATKAKKPRPSIKTKKKKAAKKIEPTIGADGVIEGEIIESEEDTMTDTTADDKINTADDAQDETLRATRESETHQPKRDNEFMDRDWGTFGTRVLFNFLYGFLACIAFTLAITLGFVQLIVMILQDKPNTSITEWMTKLSDYMRQAFDYISWQSDVKPFPFEATKD